MKLFKRTTRALVDAVDPAEVTQADLDAINRFVPAGFPRATAEDVHVCSMLVCNDMVDHYSTQFTGRALDEIVALVNESGPNGMRNHNEYGSSDLPVFRAYAAIKERRADGEYVRVRSYWERGTADGDGMAKKIALGLWREVSLSWWMESFTNSIDGKPFTESPYYPGQELPDGQVVIGRMEGVQEINEISLVARGGQKNTSIAPVAARKLDDHDVLDLVEMCRSRSTKPHGLTRLFGGSVQPST